MVTVEIGQLSALEAVLVSVRHARQLVDCAATQPYPGEIAQLQLAKGWLVQAGAVITLARAAKWKSQGWVK